MQLNCYKDYDTMSQWVANMIAAQIAAKPDSVLCLATGSTPIGTYKHLVALSRSGQVDFSKVRTFNLDEYVGLSAADDQSYQYFMEEHLFKYIPVPKENKNFLNGMAEDQNAEVLQYEENIRRAGGIDFAILGIGHNGHIGFNEPGPCFSKLTAPISLTTETIQANARFFANKQDVPRRAMTMGVQSIMRSKRIVLLANGQGKSKIIERALYGDITPQVPASILQLHPDCIVMVDQEAGKDAKAYLTAQEL